MMNSQQYNLSLTYEKLNEWNLQSNLRATSDVVDGVIINDTGFGVSFVVRGCLQHLQHDDIMRPAIAQADFNFIINLNGFEDEKQRINNYLSKHDKDKVDTIKHWMLFSRIIVPHVDGYGFMPQNAAISLMRVSSRWMTENKIAVLDSVRAYSHRRIKTSDLVTINKMYGYKLLEGVSDRSLDVIMVRLPF